VERLGVAEGDTVELDTVLLIADGDRVTVGTPTVEGAKVKATSQGEGKGKKIIVLKYKPKVRYRKKTGHRQLYTRLAIDKIVQPKAGQGEPTRKTRPRKKEVTESGA
jgi:large subunit ribosomal protein L21